jgi:hypothetical protein
MDRFEQEAHAVPVDAGDGDAEADGDVGGEAGGEAEHPFLPERGRPPASSAAIAASQPIAAAAVP